MLRMVGPAGGWVREGHMTDVGLEKVGVSGSNGGPEPYVAEQKATVLGRDDALSGRLEGDAKVGALVVQEGGVHHGVIRVHPEGVPDREEQIIIDSAARPAVVAMKSLPNPVGRVRKFWGEFF